MIRRLIWAAVIVGALYFSIQAGEFSSLDVLRQSHKRAALQAQIDSLRREVDSLKRVENAVRTDPKTQERIAREEFGLVRSGKEILYKFAAPAAQDSVAE
jgi:cell division protein FtsB